MKTTLSIESLEDRRTLSAWTVNVWDSQNLVSAAVENQMKAAGNFVMWDLDRFVSWKGTLDMVIDVQPADPNYDGFTPSILQVMPGGKNATIYEMQTGIDPMPNNPDLGMTVFLGKDGTVKLYGMKAYFDPEPGSYIAANVPTGYFDFVGVLTHECAHSLAFQAGTTDFNRYMTTDASGNRFFNGPETMRLLGRSLPLTAMGSTHYGNGALSGNIRSGLMYEWGNYAGNRLNWGKLDFAVLKDVGITVKSTEGLPFLDTMDWDRPRFVLSNSAVRENVASGTFVATVGTTKVNADYTFRLLPVLDSNKFRLTGTTLTTAATFDYETRSTYELFVRMTDRAGVYTHQKLTIRVLDVVENPTLAIPSSLTTNGGVTMQKIQIGGNNDTVVSLTINFSAAGSFGYNGTIDSGVQVSYCKNCSNPWITLTGTRAALSRNLVKIVYLGYEDSLSVKLLSNGRCFGSGTIRVTRG